MYSGVYRESTIVTYSSGAEYGASPIIFISPSSLPGYRQSYGLLRGCADFAQPVPRSAASAPGSSHQWAEEKQGMRRGLAAPMSALEMLVGVVGYREEPAVERELQVPTWRPPPRLMLTLSSSVVRINAVGCLCSIATAETSSDDDDEEEADAASLTRRSTSFSRLASSSMIPFRFRSASA